MPDYRVTVTMMFSVDIGVAEGDKNAEKAMAEMFTRKMVGEIFSKHFERAECVSTISIIPQRIHLVDK